MSQSAHPEVLVNTQWLYDRLSDPNLRIIEVDMSPEPYRDRHIPGAVFWHIFTDLLSPNLSQNLDKTAIERLLCRSGITADTTVVAYGSYPDTGAWIFWLLKLFGHERVVVLNGGYKKWIAEGRAVTTELSTFAPTDYRLSSPDPSLRVLQPEVRASLNRCSTGEAKPANCAILDVRTLAEYRGEVFMMKPPVGEERAGHIPGAVHIENLQALQEDGTFKSVEELLTLYSSQGITKDKEVFPYCAIGARSACVWFVLKYLLGYPQIRNYDGSWNEWSRLVDAPIDR